MRPGGLAAQPLGVIPGRDQQQGRGIGADAVEAEQAGGAGGHERDDEVIEPLELAVEELHAPAELPQRDADRVLGGVTGPGAQRRDRFGQRGRGEPGEPGPQVIRPGHDQRPGLVDRLGPLIAGAAFGDHQRPDRLHRAVPALRRPCCPAGLRGPRGADRVQRIRLALAVAVLAIRAVDLDDPDAGRGQVPGQPGAVAAGALDADQGEVPEPAQPAEQIGVPGRGGRELPHPQKAAERIQCGGHVHVGVGVHAAGDDACVF